MMVLLHSQRATADWTINMDTVKYVSLEDFEKHCANAQSYSDSGAYCTAINDRIKRKFAFAYRSYLVHGNPIPVVGKAIGEFDISERSAMIVRIILNKILEK